MNAPARHAARAAELGARHSMAGLLLLILVSLAFQLAAPDTSWARLVIVLLQGATLLVALWVSGTRRRIVRAAAIVVVLSTLAAIAAVAGVGGLDVDSLRAVTLLLVSLAPAAIVAGIARDVRERGAVTLHTMFGVLCVYLMLGMVFSLIFNLIQGISGDPFFTGGISGETSDFLYFSFTTLTTTGFGDFTAGTSLGRSLAVTEALVGQIYLVTVVAVIVANMRPNRRPA